jgi:hypothetical protein
MREVESSVIVTRLTLIECGCEVFQVVTEHAGFPDLVAEDSLHGLPRGGRNRLHRGFPTAQRKGTRAARK